MHNSLPYTKYTLYKLGRAVECLIESKYAMALLSSRDSFVAVLHFESTGAIFLLNEFES